VESILTGGRPVLLGRAGTTSRKRAVRHAGRAIAFVLAFAATPATMAQNASPELDAASGLVLESTFELAGRPIGRPVAIAAGPLCSLYLADAARGNVLRLDAQGTILYEFDSPRGQPGLQPLDLAVAGFKVYVLDAQSSALLRYGDEGSFLDVLRSFDPARGEMPRALSVDTSGRVLLCQTSLHQVSLLDQAHRIEAVVGGFGTRSGEMSRPMGVAFASDGAFYVADSGNRRIQRFTGVGNFAAAFGDSLAEPHGLVVTNTGELLVADPRRRSLHLYGPTGVHRAELRFDRFEPIDVALVAETVWVLSASPPALLRVRLLRGG
jgi:sugar lactone lactonase YvrE